MKNWIAVLLGITAISLTACKNDEDHNLVAKMEIRKYDSSQVEDGHPEDGLGDIANRFQQQEELAFHITLTNDGVETRQVNWPSCFFAYVQVYNSSNELVFHTEQRPIACTAHIRERILYTGESVSNILTWGQELYAEDSAGDVVATGNYLEPGEYTVVARVDINVGPVGDSEPVVLTLDEQTLTIDATSE